MRDHIGQIENAFLVVLSGNVTAQTGIPVANLIGLVISNKLRLSISGSESSPIEGIVVPIQVLGGCPFRS